MCRHADQKLIKKILIVRCLEKNQLDISILGRSYWIDITYHSQQSPEEVLILLTPFCNRLLRRPLEGVVMG